MNAVGFWQFHLDFYTRHFYIHCVLKNAPLTFLTVA